MTHQVLARKWRPRSFQEVVGQAPTVRALTNSLDQHRLHHAYLFTGTRGVGKTSLARLFAKCLNCQQGVSSTPCDKCQNCTAIDQGRFLDLLEVDAASRTKVEDTRDLLDNVQYAPTQGRYKVYLIDEVHMLSNHSFNALLKTLEEPPPHVKFLLATTDPQRLPVTVLSRCLQFHLKNLSAAQIAQQLAHILTAESISHEPAALTYLAHAAQGSMRDALSLLDQAIAYTNGQLTVQDVKTLLGATEPELLSDLLRALIKGDAKSLLDIVHVLAESGIDFHHTLNELLALLHQITLEQAVPGMTHESHAHAAEITAIAQATTAEEIQLYYQISLMGKRDLPLAPTPRSGFEMVLLRLLAFRPHNLAIDGFLMGKTQLAAQITTPTKLAPALSTPKDSRPTALTTPALPRIRSTATAEKNHLAPGSMPTDGWASLLPLLKLQGPASMLASHCVLLQHNAERLQLGLDPHHTGLLNKTTETQLTHAIQSYFSKPVSLTIEVVKSEQETPASLDKKQAEQRQYQAVNTLAADKNLQNLIEQFDGKIIPNSIKAKKPNPI